MSEQGYTPNRQRREQTEAPITKRAEETRRERRRRDDTSPTSGLKLHVPEHLKEPGYVYRWFNEDEFSQSGEKGGNRIYAKTKLDDWDVVTTKEGVEGEGEGTPVKRHVDRRSGRVAYLCKKPEDWYRQDKGVEQDAIKRREEDMRRGTSQSPEGLKGSTAYVPEGGIRIGQGP